MERSVRVYAPASIGNVIVGFDVLGLAVASPGDEVIVNFNDSQTVRIVKIEGDEGRLPLDTDKNTAGIGVMAMLRKLNSRQGFDISIKKNLPLGSGMGSSAASAVAAVVAANELLDNPFKKEELLPFLMEAEKLASGTAHGDNVAPCLLGGLIMVKQNEPLLIHRLPFPDKIKVVLIKPAVEVLTKQARMLLKEQIPLNNVVNQFSNLGGFIAGLYESDIELMRESLEDFVAEPVRAMMIPGYDQIKLAAKQLNAIGCGISGSGPTMFAFVESQKQGKELEARFIEEFKNINMNCISFLTEVSKEGAIITG